MDHEYPSLEEYATAPNPGLGAPLADRLVAKWDPAVIDPSPGRRLRVFAAAIQNASAPQIGTKISLRPVPDPSWSSVSISPLTGTLPPMTYRAALDWTTTSPEARELRESLGSMPLTFGNGFISVIRDIPEEVAARDPELNPALQDLGDEINEDVTEACEAISNPDIWYAGIDEGIAPVPDSHVELVIWALQRELNRELRPGPRGGPRLPPVRLSDLPWRVQRALVERRRYRYQQYGITHEVWASQRWSLWDIPEDPDFIPRRSARKRK